tara:strand:+ start:468 stop:1400 length:933 start_codon:yes stop_codon:yes gene_type:complete
MKKLAIISLFFGLVSNGYSQQDAMFTYYMFNHQSVNPAYVGSKQIINATMLNRSQWTGFAGAPLSHTISLNAPLLNESLGFGFSFSNDVIGPASLNNLTLDLAYHLKFNGSENRLAFGLKAGGNHTSLDLNNLSLDDQNDPAFNPDNNGKFMPNYGFGLYYYTPKWYLGFSSPHMVNYDFNATQRHYFVIAGALFELNDIIKFRPSSYIKLTNNAPVTMDLTGMLIFKDRMWGGLAFRSSFGMFVPSNNKGGGFGLLAGINLSDQLSLGYSFGYSLGNQTFTYNGGTHEIVLRYDYLYKEKKIIKSPRYF